MWCLINFINQKGNFSIVYLYWLIIIKGMKVYIDNRYSYDSPKKNYKIIYLV